MKLNISITRYALCFILLTFLINACKEDEAATFEIKEPKDFTADIPLQWFGLHLKLVKETPGFSPPVAARSFAYAGMTVYESTVQGSRSHISLANKINGYKGEGVPQIKKGEGYNWDLVVNAAMATFYRNLFKTATSENKASIDALELDVLTQNAKETEEIKDRSISFGKSMGQAIYDYSKTDNQDEAYKNNFPDYTIPVFPGAWVPTSAANPKPLQPYWGSVRPFLSADVEDGIIPPHLAYSTDKTSLFYLEAYEVYLYSINQTESQRVIAQYWSDDPGLTATPPGHSVSLTLQILAQEKSDLQFAAELLAKIGMAVHDGFVSCWKCKYIFSLMRPVTYINENIDPNWKTLLNTPPFPEHTSGHSVQTAASMTVLESFFGYNYSIVDRTHENRNDINGSPRSFNSFAQIASEAAFSRLYGGIHYRTGIEVGVMQGNAIGRNIAAINLKK
jgi:PAP2 superfamily